MKLYPLIMIAAACLAAPTFAQTVQDDQRSVSVPLAGVRFDDPRSIADLRHRIDRAVRQVCAPAATTLDEHMQVRACRIGALKTAERQLARYVGQTRMAAVEPR